MKTATITEAKNRLSALIDRVRGGETILILDSGTAVARIEPIATRSDQTGRIARLERSGTLKAGTGVPPLDLLDDAPPALRQRTSAVAALLDERRAGR